MDHGAKIPLSMSAWPEGGFLSGEVWTPAVTSGPIPQGVASPLLFVGSPVDLPDTAFLPDIRIAGALPAPRAADHIRQVGNLDIVWLAGADMVESGVLADICAAVEEQGCNLICETLLSALDRVAAAIPVSIPVQLLVAADPADKLVALAAARRTRHGVVQDRTRDDAMERIDRLQEEVERISRLLGDLAAQHGGILGVPPGFVSRAEDYADYPEEVRTPPRDYTATPRSFIPEERAVDRQRAKRVRRMLRQRRMREQYFPADLFADPAWDMLLDLYAARLERQPVSVSSLCIAAAVPATTALRWIKTMTDAGMFVREADPLDGRRIFIGLAEAAFESLVRYFEALEE